MMSQRLTRVIESCILKAVRVMGMTILMERRMNSIGSRAPVMMYRSKRSST